MTNGEKIRAGNDAELAFNLAGFFATVGELAPHIPNCPEDEWRWCHEYGYQKDCEGCPKTIENWLKAEVEE